MKQMPSAISWEKVLISKWALKDKLDCRLPKLWKRGKSAMLDKISQAGTGMASCKVFYPSPRVRDRGIRR